MIPKPWSGNWTAVDAGHFLSWLRVWRAASGTTGGGGWLHGAWTRAGRSHQLKAFATWGESIRRGLRDCSGRGRGWAPPLLWIMPCHLPYNWKQSLKTEVKVLSQSMLPDFRNSTAFFFTVPRLLPFVPLVRTCKWRWVWSTGGRYWQGRTRVLGEKPVHVPLCPPHISHVAYI